MGNSVERKNVILFDNTQAPHYNYVGDLILRYKAHVGTGSITCDVTSDKTLVVVQDNGEGIHIDLKKLARYGE